MSYHHCPIEPDDWANGPNDDGEECPECDGNGIVTLSEGLAYECQACGGCGYRTLEHYED
jgi:hypothetical protein